MIPYGDNNPTRGTAWVTYALILTNVVIFLFSFRLTPTQQFELHVQAGFIPARMAQLTDPQRVVVIPVNQIRRWGPFQVQLPIQLALVPNRTAILCSLVTCQFLHGGWMHLLGNMLYLLIFGNNLEDRLGHLRWLMFYLLGGVFAILCHWLTDPQSITPTIGASGAVAAVLGGYLVTWPHARVQTLIPLGWILIPVELPALLVLGLWFVGQLLSVWREWAMDLGGGVAFAAHIGGFILGAVVLLIWNRWSPPEQTFNREREPWLQAERLG